MVILKWEDRIYLIKLKAKLWGRNEERKYTEHTVIWGNRKITMGFINADENVREGGILSFVINL